ncbi:MAG: tetratricopeptide repeat protein [Tenuifilaceae bacterium]
MKFRLITLVIFQIVSLQNIFAQDQIKLDSLKVRLENESTDTIQIRLLKELSSIAIKTDLKVALDYSKQALEIAKKTGNKKVLSNAYTQVASNLIFIGIYDESLKYFIESLRIAEKLGDESLLFPLYHNIGVLKDRLQQFDEALEFYFKALAILDKISQKDKNEAESGNKYPTLYNSIGNIYSSKGDKSSAKDYYLKAYNLAKGKDFEIFGTICNNLGKLGIEIGDYDNAYKYLTESLNFRIKKNDQYGIAKTYIFLSLYYKEIKQNSQAIEYATKALNISHETKAMLSLQNATNMLSDIYYETKDFEKSLEYFKQYKTFNDSLLNDKKYSEIAKLQLQYENEIIDKVKEVKDQERLLVMIIIISTLFLSSIIMGLLFFLSKSRNKRIKLENEKLEKEMQLKNKELTTNVMYLLKKNELIENITERLLKLKGKLKEENAEPIQKIIFDLQSLTEKEVWEEFEYRFQSVHEEFYQNLQRKFPDLTPSEIKLAAFLRLNMTTKEIASITGQSISGLEMARYRLRKKLGITNQEINLVNFLLNI